MSAYFKNISRGIRTTVKGMSLTLRHLWQARNSRQPFAVENSNYFDLKTGIVTLQYPHQTLPVPDNGRYQLDCEIDDCIVCDKCAKICPVDCIEIEPIKSAEIINYASDGSPIRLYAAKFDIDMAKCCFCGLCTSVCPTECLTMTNEYDFSVFDISQMNFQFSNLTEEQADAKRKLYEQYLEEKEALKKAPQAKQETKESTEGEAPKAKVSFKPAFKTTPKPTVEDKETENSRKAKQEFDKVIPNAIQNTEDKTQENNQETPKPKPAFKPSFKPVTKSTEQVEQKTENKTSENIDETPKPKP
ncbi:MULTISPECIES: 4Fe-4S binding protein, partial [Emticicia]|uniref:4Fe-4S binding protein n=1 Tax=Emticicia TaxID=312278 RepID=UPI000B330E3E